MDEDHLNDIYDYFKESTTDKIDDETCAFRTRRSSDLVAVAGVQVLFQSPEPVL